MKKAYNWGIIGTGAIARLFTQGLQALEQARLYAVGSRDLKTARAFASQWQIQRAFGSYRAVFEDPAVDVVYIATPHSFHCENVRAALEAGKHVLCEKPFTINARQARDLIELARQQQLFLMDAMWNRFQPWQTMVRSILDQKLLGDLLHLKADLSFHFPFDPQHRLFNPVLGGGSLLDLGVYPIALASLFFGKPEEILSRVHECATGVDDQVSMLFGYSSGATALLGCSSRFNSLKNTTLHGSKGYLEIHGMIGRPQALTLHLNGEEARRIETPTAVNGYHYEGQAVMDSLDQNHIEHPLMPLDETLEIMETLDLIRRQTGVVYPGEG